MPSVALSKEMSPSICLKLLKVSLRHLPLKIKELSYTTYAFEPPLPFHTAKLALLLRRNPPPGYLLPGPWRWHRTPCCKTLSCEVLSLEKRSQKSSCEEVTKGRTWDLEQVCLEHIIGYMCLSNHLPRYLHSLLKSGGKTTNGRIRLKILFLNERGP